MAGTPIQTLIIADMITRLKAMTSPTYTYTFDRVEKVKGNMLTVGDEKFAFVWSGPVSYDIAGTQAALTKLRRTMSFVVGFVLTATPTDATDPLSTDRDAEAVLVFADIHKCLFAMDGQTLGNTIVSIFFDADIKDLTEIEENKIYGELHGRVQFRHNLGDATTHS